MIQSLERLHRTRGKKCELLRIVALLVGQRVWILSIPFPPFVIEPFNFFLVSSILSLDGLYAKMHDVFPHLSPAVMRQHIPAARRNFSGRSPRTQRYRAPCREE